MGMAAVVPAEPSPDIALVPEVQPLAVGDPLVVPGARLRIGQAAIGLLDVVQPARQVARMVGMMPPDQPRIGSADLGRGGVAGDPQQLVEIASGHGARATRRASASVRITATRAVAGS